MRPRRRLGPGDRRQQARLSPDGSLVAIENNGRLHLVATATGASLAVCETPTNPAGICVNEVCSADGRHLHLLWQYGSVHLWNLGAMHRELAVLGLGWTGPRQAGVRDSLLRCLEDNLAGISGKASRSAFSRNFPEEIVDM